MYAVGGQNVIEILLEYHLKCEKEKKEGIVIKRIEKL
jgi:hypothetical protein